MTIVDFVVAFIAILAVTAKHSTTLKHDRTSPKIYSRLKLNYPLRFQHLLLLIETYY